MTSVIPLTRGYVTVVDDDDYEWLSKYKWCANVKKGGVYAYRTEEVDGTKTGVYMHRQILDIHRRKDVEGDHVSGDTLDNRRPNLRAVTHAQNMINQKMRSDNTPGVKGVDYVKKDKCYRARVHRNGSEIVVGYAKTLEEAKALRKSAQEKFYGEFVRSSKASPVVTGGLGL
jgi:hypothetical protein